MNTLKLILKGMLLWITTFAVMLFMSGVDSIMDNGYFIQSLAIIAILCYVCYLFISKEELEKITLYKWFNKLMEE